MSDSNMTVPRGLVIGTAGHIDHGKTSLVRALTGIDTDRLAEEKRRGISIDLGFAHLTIDDLRLSFIDVPGHERFVKNMLAGAAGIQAVLLVVAADESVKPQTREHFEICRLLGIQHGVIALTKTDLASPEEIAITTEDVRNLGAGSFLENTPVVPVSVVTGSGLEELKETLVELATCVEPRERSGLMRLPIDRSFAVKGFGTVVTGTMWNGALHSGDTVLIHPGKRAARVRGLQVHGEPVEIAAAGQRTAVNLTGIEHSEIGRGDVLTLARELEPSKLMDVAVDWLKGVEKPRKREQFLLHIGTAEIPVLLKVLDRDEAFSRSLVRLWLAEPIIAIPGDRFVLRHASPMRTVAGGVIVDAAPPARLNRAKTLARLESLASDGPGKRIEILVEESTNGRRFADLIRMTGLPGERIKALIRQNSRLVSVEAAQRAVSVAWIERQRAKIFAWLHDFHAKHPGAVGAPIAGARLNLEANLAAAVFEKWAAVRVKGDLIAVASHTPQVSAQDTLALSSIERAFQQAGVQPPAPADVLRSAGTDSSKGRGLLEALIKSQKLVRISEDLVFHAEALTQIRRLVAAHKGRRFSIPEFKEWTQISRKYAIPLLEYLDRQHVTRREGDARIVL